MFDKQVLKRTLNVHLYVYKLVPWLENAIYRNAVSPNDIALLSTDNALCLDWFKSQYHSLPTENRPGTSLDELTDYACMLSGMLFDAFELETNPGVRYVPHRLRSFHKPSKTARNSHLHPKKLTKKDRFKAIKLKVSYLEKLCNEHGIVLPDSALNLPIPRTNDALAIATYAGCLVRRMHGHKEGPAVLALWREFAWNKGGPIKNYKLKVSSILKAENLLVVALK